MKNIYFIILIIVIFSKVNAQFETNPFVQNFKYAPKPTITPDLVKYFELDGHARDLVDMLTGPRPGGFFPEKTYEVAQKPNAKHKQSNKTPDGLDVVGRAVEQFLTGSPNDNSFGNGKDFNFPPGFNQGFSLKNGNNPVASFQQNNKPISKNVEEKLSKSSISGIPNDFPKLPKFPFLSLAKNELDKISRHQEPLILNNVPEIPKLSSRPEVPEGGLGLVESNIRRHPTSVSKAILSNALSSSAADASEYGTLTDETHVPGGLIGTVLDLFGFYNKDGKMQTPDPTAVNKAMANLLNANNSPLLGKNVISNVLYKALTSGSIQSNTSNASSLFNLNNSAPITLNSAQQAAINENLEMIQNLIAQPSSPLCNPKPTIVTEFNIDAFMGQWYQVVYSPPFTQSACSVVSYKKLSTVKNGGIGSIFEVFEYTTDGMPYAKPKITSGYAILKQVGELIFRTTAHQDDVNVRIIFTGPINANGEYDFIIMTTNCNYPVYVFARDPVVYKQQYEDVVTEILEQKGITNGFSRLLNIVAPVDASTCIFPPTLFNVKGQ